MTEISEIHAYIIKAYLEVCDRASRHGLPTNNIIIRCRNEVKETLGLGDAVLIRDFEVPVIADDGITDRIMDNGNIQSDIYIYDENWGEVE